VGMAGVAATGDGAMELTLNIGQFLLASVTPSATSKARVNDLLV